MEHKVQVHIPVQKGPVSLGSVRDRCLKPGATARKQSPLLHPARSRHAVPVAGYPSGKSVVALTHLCHGGLLW